MGKRRKYTHTFDYDSDVKKKLFGDKAALNIIYAARSIAPTEKGLRGLRSSERTRFLKKYFERFEHIQN